MNYQSPKLEYIESQTLVKIIDESTNPDDFVILDVRDLDEFGSGHIVGAKHLESTKWLSKDFVSQVVNEHKNTKKIIVHCFMSQQRGPTCAKLLTSHLDNLSSQESSTRPEM
jgi:Cdc25 family phosphatase